MNLAPRISRRFLVALAAMTILFVLLVAASVRLIVSESELSEDITEDMVWLASQGQYEAVRFRDALSGYGSGEVTAEDLQLRLDLLTSRVSVLERGEPRRQIEALGYADQLDDYRQVLDTIRERLQALEPDAVEEIASLREVVPPIALSLRDVANAALFAKRDRVAWVRDLRRNALFEILGTLVATMIAGLLLAAIVVRDHRNIASAEAALERERQVSRLHRAFISVVSHQFRTPLAIIDASAQRMIRRGTQMPHDEIMSRAGKIRTACQRLTRLMESTINAARLEDGEISFAPRACDLIELLRGLRESQPDEDQDRIELDLGELPQWIEADATLLEHAVQNLVSNALKYSPAGSAVGVRARKVGEEIEISVTDAGVGIPADEVGSLFRRFYRARTAEGIPGTGIGLSFVAQIMELHHGRVAVESTEGVGSTFTLRWPYRPAHLADAAPATTPSEAQI
ncbi:sensor histidine kinase [Devosia nitrariae]|uniref:histidine kinase n=1 Tax=Devosia nitrariae TaxID=2071872 RepID=A0ABQ5VZV6_9HYPH|nr:HAMP domain-containing sensor histidine kinase [Devosia nitrariae]GLQ53084.1 hypothetical protein GCM10010862_03420 [Devosia nitrariae]